MKNWHDMQRWSKQNQEQRKKNLREKREEQTQRNICKSVQTRIDESTWEDSTDGIYGKTTEWKEECMMWVTFMNIGSLPFDNVASKNKEIWALVQNNKFDILGLAELEAYPVHAPTPRMHNDMEGKSAHNS